MDYFFRLFHEIMYIPELIMYLLSLCVVTPGGWLCSSMNL